MRRKCLPVFFLLVILLFVSCATGVRTSAVGGQLRVENGAMQVMLAYSDPRADDYSNAQSEILRYCVYVETDFDTDNDGKADLVKVLVQVPRAAAEGNFKAATIYDPTPYVAGTTVIEDTEALYEEVPFDYGVLYRQGEKRSRRGNVGTLEAAMAADPMDWNYMVPLQDDVQGYYSMQDYDYFLVRGYAVVMACGIGTYGSEGFELCGLDIERDSHKAVIQWLTGDRVAFTDRESDIAIKADWSNGNVAMTGCSYGGTLPFEVATTGVRGLRTIIPFSGITSWYDYTNSQGIPITFDTNYADYLAAFNCGGVFTDDGWTTLKPGYGSYLWQISSDQRETNGDWAPVWEWLDYSDDHENINCSALVVQGLNDFNVTARQSDLMVRAFERAGMPVKLVLHQEGHKTLEGRLFNGELWDEIMNQWLSHYLYNVDNGIENMAAVTVQSNIDGSFRTYGSWREFKLLAPQASNLDGHDYSFVDSAPMAPFFHDMYGVVELDDDMMGSQDEFYAILESPMAARYMLDVPEGTTIYGVPQVRVRLATDQTDFDGLMITAVLVDVADDFSGFNAFRSWNAMEYDTSESYEIGGGHEDGVIMKPLQGEVGSKSFSYGWTDLKNPGCGYESSDYVLQAEAMNPGEFYDYTFYMIPTVYTVAPGHRLMLVITAWDPFRAFLDEDFRLDPDNPPVYSDFTYSFMIDNTSLEVLLPVAATAAVDSVELL